MAASKNTITHNAVVKTTWRLTDCGRETKENQNVCFSINSVVDQQQFVSRSSSETQQVNINSFTLPLATRRSSVTSWSHFNLVGDLTFYTVGSQSGVRGPPGVLEGVPGGTQLDDGYKDGHQMDTYWFVTLRVYKWNRFHLYTSQS